MKNTDIVTIQDLCNSDTDGYMPILMEIYNPDIVWDSDEYEQDNCYLRLVADDNKVKYKGHTWIPSAFDFTPPETDGSKIGSASVSISAIDARVKRLLRLIKVACEVKIIAMFAKVEKEDTGKFVYKFIPLDNLSFKMETASSSNTVATFNLTFDNYGSQNVPYDVATQDRVPSVSQS